MIKRKGFTLIELLVVIAIIALLMAILMPSLARVRRQAQSVACQARLKQWGLAFKFYTDDNNGYFNRREEKLWMQAMEPYYNRDPDMLLCPTATRLMENSADWGTFKAAELDPYVFSYGINSWVNNNAADRSGGRLVEWFWKNVQNNTTVAPGTTEFVAWPILKKAFAQRGIDTEPLLAHSFERVMPGKDYVASIRDFWRVCSGCNDQARNRVERFLREVLNTQDYPLTVMDRPIESETTKIVENSYRATILAFMNEWSLFAERNGVDLIKVIQAIKMRPTHSNIIFPGPGIGGYCLPKDGGLGYWAYRHILGFEDGDAVFRITPEAIDTNDTRALHVAELTRDALRNMGRYIAGASVVLCGASYRQDVGDTRYSGSEIVVRKLTEMGAEIQVHDPYVDHWYELEQQDVYPAPGHSWSRFFRNQEGLTEIRVSKDLPGTLANAEAMILAVPHQYYLTLNPDDIVKWAGNSLAIIDCFGILSDTQIEKYFSLGCEVKGLGRGHIQRLKKKVKKEIKKN